MGPGELFGPAAPFLNELARDTGLDPALERVLVVDILRDRLGDDPPGEGGAGRVEKREGSNADAEELAEA